MIALKIVVLQKGKFAVVVVVKECEQHSFVYFLLYLHINILETKINVLIVQQNVCHVLCSKMSTPLLFWIAYLCVLFVVITCSYTLTCLYNLYFCVSKFFNLCMHCPRLFFFQWYCWCRKNLGQSDNRNAFIIIGITCDIVTMLWVPCV
jgi:hypothetical protein